MIDCNNCDNCSITEETQRNLKNGNRKAHMCLKHNKRVLHRSQSKYAVRLFPCKECNGEDFIGKDKNG